MGVSFVTGMRDTDRSVLRTYRPFKRDIVKRATFREGKRSFEKVTSVKDATINEENENINDAIKTCDGRKRHVSQGILGKKPLLKL